jgi:ABC-type glycerol-3-phosphate transport system substrate-binding protein
MIKHIRTVLTGVVALTLILTLSACNTPTPVAAPPTVVQTVVVQQTVPVQQTVVVKQTVEVPITPVPSTMAMGQEACKALGPVTITDWRHFTPSGETVIKQLVEDYKQVAPNITVQVELIPDNEYAQKLNTSIAGGVGPDSFRVYSQDYETWLNSGNLAAIDPVLFGYKDVDEMLKTRFLPGTLDFAVKDGMLYAGGMPEYGTWAIAYNKGAFDKAGVAYPPEDKILTWDEYFDLAKKLTLMDANGNMTQMGEGMWITAQDNPTGAFIIMDPLFKQLGGDAFDPATGMPTNKEVWLKVAQMMSDSAKNGKYGYVDMGFPTSTNAHPEMFNGRVAMVMAGIWAKGWGLSVNPELQIGFARLPEIDDTHNAAGNLGWVWVVNANSTPEKQKAAQCWIEFISNDKNIFTWYDTAGEVEPRTTAGYMDHLVISEPGMKVFNLDAPRGTNPAYGEKGAERWDIIRKMAEAIFKNGDAPDKAVDDAWTLLTALAQ